jgi:hypothetical protein
MRHEKPSTTARKVALNIISLGAKPGMEEVLPAGIVDATARLLIAAGVVVHSLASEGERRAVAVEHSTRRAASVPRGDRLEGRAGSHGGSRQTRC